MSLKKLILMSIIAYSQNGVTSSGLKVHEWGTFTSLVGSDGFTQNGMYHEDEKLPDFVHGFGELLNPQSTFGFTGINLTPPPPPPPCRGKGCFLSEFYDNNITQKMETPVLYFYSPTPLAVKVNVKFPRGIFTESFPAPVSTFPLGTLNPQLQNGESTYEVDVLAQLGPAATGLPEVDSENIYGHARNVASNVIQAQHEREQFIFYRGLGQFQPSFVLTSEKGSLLVDLPNSASRPKAAFLVDVDQHGNVRMMNADYAFLYNGLKIAAETIQELRNHALSDTDYIIDTRDLVRSTLIKNLIGFGLNQDEAIAMMDTWESGYLKTPGLRLLYILPRAEVDEILPLEITPTPDAVARVFVGRIEILLDTDELQVLANVAAEREKFEVKSLGRFAESILRRVREVHAGQPLADPSLLAVFDGLIKRAQEVD